MPQSITSYNRITRVMCLLLVFIGIASAFLFSGNVKQVFADLACGSGSTCSGSQAYQARTFCEPGTYVGAQCLNGGNFNTYSVSCPTGGGPGSCSGTAQNVLGCQGYTTVGDDAYDCTCSSTGESIICNEPGWACGAPVPYNGTCINCQPHQPLGLSCAQSDPEDGSLSCCNSDSPPPPTTPPPPPPPTSPPPGVDYCEVTLTPGATTLQTGGQTLGMTANVSNVQNGVVTNVTFVSGTTGVATVAPASDNTAPNGYTTTATTGGTVGTTTITTTVYVDGNNTCSDTATITTQSTPCTPSCTVTMNPPNAAMQTGGSSVPFTANIGTVSCGAVTNVAFTSSNASVATVSPTNDNVYEYQTNVTPSASNTGSSNITANVYVNGTQRCSVTSPVTVTVNPPTPCTLDLAPASASTYVGNINPPLLEAMVTPNGSTVSNVQFFTANSGISYPTVLFDSTYKYQTSAVAVANGSTTFTAIATMANGLTCQDSSTITVTNNPDPTNEIPDCGNFSLPSTINQGTVVPISCIINDDGVLAAADMYYIPYPQANYCVGAPPWVPVINQNTGNNLATLTLISAFPPTWRADWLWNTSTIPTGDYLLAANVADTEGYWCTGNPSGTCGAADAACPNCNGITEITQCTPSCAFMCGQSDGCGGTCGSSDNGTPTAPNVTALGIFDMTNVNPQQVPFSWSSTSPITDGWEVKIYRGATAAPGGACAASPTSNQSLCLGIPSPILPLATTSYNYTPLQNLTSDVKISVRAVNNTCVPFGAATTRSGWTTQTVNLVGDVAGTVYLDPNAVAAGNLCSGDTSTPVALPNGSSAVGTGQGGNPVITDTFNGSETFFSINDLPFFGNTWSNPTAQVALNIDNSADPANSYMCTCPNTSACTLGGLRSPQLFTDFFVGVFDLSHEPWWQTRGGQVYAQSGYVTEIPDTCDGSTDCEPYLSSQDTSNKNKSGGVAITTGGAVIGIGSGSYTDHAPEVNVNFDQPRVNTADFSGVTVEDYDYFAQNFNLSSVNQINTATVTTEPSGGAQSDGSQIFYRNGDLTVDPSAAWALTAGEKKVIFVNGNLTLDGPGGANNQLMTVASGAFLGFIVEGDIIINSNVGHADPTAWTPDTTPANIIGVFIAGDDIIVMDDGDGTVSDNKFVGSGSFVAWDNVSDAVDGVELNRDYLDDYVGAALNAEWPIEEFRLRPDLVKQFPTSLRRPTLNWQEVN